MTEVSKLKMTLTLSQVAAALRVDLVGEDRTFSQVSINTRTIEAGDLFIAIKGENFDSHEFLNQAEEKGACGLVIDQNIDSALPQIRVDNTRIALGDIASLWRSSFTLPIIAITGSCGKTTVKEMTAAILAQAHKKDKTTLLNDEQKSNEQKSDENILATRGNLNNDIGVPLTLLRLNKEHEAAVIELGANHIGEIKQLVKMVRPDVAVITNAAHAHIEGFGSLEGVAKAKAEIYTGLESGGTAVINADDPFADFWRDYCQDLNNGFTKSGQSEQHGKINTLTFGLDNSADISADYTQLSDGLELHIKTPAGEQLVVLKQFGKHNVYNALASTAAAIASGCSLDDVRNGLQGFTNVSGRLEQKQGLQGAVIFDDTYNANPGSVIAGIEAIQQAALQQNNSEIMLIFGDMGELGEESKQLHYQLGVDAAKMGIRRLFTVGNYSRETCAAFNVTINKQNNKSFTSVEDSSNAEHFATKKELIQNVQNTLHKNSVVLIKGSRSMGMESVVDALVDSPVDTRIHLNKNKSSLKEGDQ